jgi:hypothetical protein
MRLNRYAIYIYIAGGRGGNRGVGRHTEQVMILPYIIISKIDASLPRLCNVCDVAATDLCRSLLASQPIPSGWDMQKENKNYAT